MGSWHTFGEGGTGISSGGTANPSGLEALFSMSPSSGASPLTVNFTDESTPGISGPITDYEWDFGDGNTSTLQNPSNDYLSDGTYIITLRITGSGTDGTDSFTTTITVGTGGTTGDPPVTVGSEIFSDDFVGATGLKPDSTKWQAKSYTSGASGAVFAGLTLIELDGASNLKITAQKSSSGVWQCGFITSKSGYSGSRYTEGKAKMAPGFGTWNAPVWEWAFPNGGPGLENDVNEQLGKQPDQYHCTLHNWNTSAQSGITVSTGVNLSTDFHIYGSALYSDHVDFYFDNSKVATILASAVGMTDLTTFEVAACIDLNMGGSWAGTPTIAGPVDMLVDWYKVWSI